MSAPRASVVRLVLVANLAVGASAACGADPTPRGYHSPNVAWSEDELGLVWLDRRAPYEAVVFGRAGKDAKLKAPAFELTQHAWHSEPPLVASDGRGWLVAWTQAGGRDPGLFVRAVGPGGPEGPQQTIVESSVRPCPQLLWTGDAYVIGWNEADGIHLGRLSAGARLEAAPMHVAAEASIEACRVAWGNGELGVLWSAVRGEGRSLSMARVSLAGELLERIEVSTEAPVGAGPIDLAWHEGAWVVGHTSPEQPGARTVRVVSNREQSPGPALAREGFVRGLSLASAGWLGAGWSETARPGANKARIFFGVLGSANDPLELGTGRPAVNTSAHDRRLASITWSSRANGGSIHWAVITFRPRDASFAIETSSVATGSLAPARAQ